MRAAFARLSPQGEEEADEATEREIGQLATAIERYKLECDKFLNGATLVLPEEGRARIAQQLRELRASQIRGVAENFRLSTLEARFNALTERFGRMLRTREEGRAPGLRAGAPPPESRFDAASGVVLDRKLEPEAVEALFAGLARRGASRFDLDSFREYLSKQLDVIRSKTGAQEVQFRVAEEDGKLKLKAKPVGTQS
ncbi:MAG: hypothetical protein H6511_03745 [Holophagales bacterium]|nr:hypothetical protein [Holophagales bacterium]